MRHLQPIIAHRARYRATRALFLDFKVDILTLLQSRFGPQAEKQRQQEAITS